jgi:hypothetical protein
MEYSIQEVAVNLTSLPGAGGKVRLMPDGTPISGVILNSDVPPGLGFRLWYGDNPVGLRYGPGGLFAQTDICPRITKGLYASWDVASPGTVVKIAVEVARGSGTTAAP